MSKSLSLSQLLIRQGPPSIMVRTAQPGWQSLSRRLLLVAALMLFGGAFFLAGWYFNSAANNSPSAAIQHAEPTPATDVGEPLPATVESFGLEEKVRQQLMERRALEGLEIQSLQVRPEGTSPLTLRYQFTVANTGRPYAGRMVFVIQGVLKGHSLLWLYPTDRQRSDPRFEMRVERYFQGDGSIPLPDGFEPQAIALQLHEPAGVRASRSVPLDSGPPGGARK